MVVDVLAALRRIVLRDDHERRRPKRAVGERVDEHARRLVVHGAERLGRRVRGRDAEGVIVRQRHVDHVARSCRARARARRVAGLLEIVEADVLERAAGVTRVVRRVRIGRVQRVADDLTEDVVRHVVRAEPIEERALDGPADVDDAAAAGSGARSLRSPETIHVRSSKSFARPYVAQT